MLSRRTLITFAATALALAPRASGAVTEAPLYTRWPQIQGPCINPSRTRLITGRGIRHEVKNSFINHPDLSFAQNQEANASMALASGMVLARSMGPTYPLVAMDAATGRVKWERERVQRILGVYENLVYIVVAPDSPGNYPILKAVVVDRPSDLWATGEYETAGSVVVPDHALVYARLNEDRSELLARELRSGKPQWHIDITGDVDGVPDILATNGEVVVGGDTASNRYRLISAWSVETGDLIWQHESSRFLSSPAFRGDDVIIATEAGVQRIDSDTGEVLSTIEMPPNNGGMVKLALTDDALILVDPERIHAIDWATGEVIWSRASVQAESTRDLIVCDGMILRVEDATETTIQENALRGYDLEDGRLILDYRPIDADQNEVKIASFVIGNGNLYLATNKGVGAWFQSDVERDPTNDPVLDREFVSDEFGFTYSWDQDWEVTGSTFMTPGGQAFYNVVNNAAAAQYAGAVRESDTDLASNWHVNLGPDTRSIRGVQPMETSEVPDLEFVPVGSTVIAALYHTTFNAPYDQVIGVRVLIPLLNGSRLVFEFLQAESLFDQDLPSFATFFENLFLPDDES